MPSPDPRTQEREAGKEEGPGSKGRRGFANMCRALWRVPRVASNEYSQRQPLSFSLPSFLQRPVTHTESDFPIQSSSWTQGAGHDQGPFSLL
jgi:hypothetical protein